MSQTPVHIEILPLAGGYHGGAWKVAYADFVTAMMAFFLLLWLLNVTTDEQKNAISNYFDPTHPKVSDFTSGAGGVMGGLSMSPQGAMATDVQNVTQPTVPRAPERFTTEQGKKAQKGEKTSAQEALEKAKEELKKQEDAKFQDTAAQIKQAIEEDPELAELSKNILIDMTPEGLRIQIVDEKGRSMFAKGSARMFEQTQKLMQKMADIIEGNTINQLSIRGHTDSIPYGEGADYTNWELSTDRANASRRVMLDNGFPTERINNVVGKADTEHLMPDDPTNARNRRITVILLREELTDPNYQEKLNQEAEKIAPQSRASGNGDEDGPSANNAAASGAPSPAAPQVPIGTFRRTPGQVQFP